MLIHNVCIEKNVMFKRNGCASFLYIFFYILNMENVILSDAL